MRIRSRDELFQKADQFIIRRYDDGRIDAIDAFRRKSKIHSTQAIYETREGLKRLANVIGFLFPEVWNSLETPELNWYDRNPLNVVKTNYNGYGTHNKTTRWTYTVPAGRKAYVELLYARILMYAVASDAITLLDFAGFDLNNEAIGYANRHGNAVLDSDTFQVGQSILLMPADVLTAWSAGYSNGSKWIFQTMKATEFDA